jgi:hypothetical protein
MQIDARILALTLIIEFVPDDQNAKSGRQIANIRMQKIVSS